MLNDEDVISIRRIKDCFTKLIELNRINFIKTNNTREMYNVFRDVYKITSMEEKIIYLLCVYAVNCDESIMIILNDTGILCNEIVSNILENGIRENEIISPILKDYIKNNTMDCLIELIEDINEKYINNKKKDNIVYENRVDYNISHLKRENIKNIEDRNQKLKRKIRRKILYDKYQRGY